jgi:RNA polymerase sigma factor (sigma-70 family)
VTSTLTPAEYRARFQRWMGDHAAILYRVAAGFALGVDRDDLMQELLIALWKAIPAFRGDAQPATFVYRVSHNAAMAWKRSARRHDRAQGDPDALQRMAAPAGPDDAQRELLEAVYARIRELPELDRSLVLLSLDGLSYREMATIHGLSESNVGARLSRSKARLVRQLKELTDDPR